MDKLDGQREIIRALIERCDAAGFPKLHGDLDRWLILAAGNDELLLQVAKDHRGVWAGVDRDGEGRFAEVAKNLQVEEAWALVEHFRATATPKPDRKRKAKR